MPKHTQEKVSKLLEEARADFAKIEGKGTVVEVRSARKRIKRLSRKLQSLRNAHENAARSRPKPKEAASEE